MHSRRTSWAVLSVVCLAACLSTSPPAPAVRYFDPSPTIESANPAPRAYAIHVTTAAHLGREIVVRTGPREVVFDPLHSWIAAPRELVEDAIARAGAPAGKDAPMCTLHVTTFEIDLVEAAQAHVRCEFQVPNHALRVIDTTAAAAGRTPEAFAAAMAVALGAAIAQLGAVR